MKSKATRGFFDEEYRLQKLSGQKDPLVKLNETINWEVFRSILDTAIPRVISEQGGRPPYDNVLMCKILILQRYYNLSDEQTQFQILDRLSFMRFLGLGLCDNVPDAKTIWLFKNTLIQKDCIECLFFTFTNSLTKAGLIAHEGKLIDASFVEVPKQRNTKQENEQLKAGILPAEWKEKPNKLSQKDVDAKWTKKNNQNFYGYKNHIKADEKSKLIDCYIVTDASVHDSQLLYDLLEDSDNGQSLHGDSAYRSEETEDNLDFLGIDSQINEKSYKNAPLTEEQKASNKEKSKVRARVEHVFGFIENSMKGSFIKSIGLKKAKGIIGLMNLTYNMFRAIQLITLRGLSVHI